MHIRREGTAVAVMRDRLRILGAFLLAPVLGVASEHASAGAASKKAKRKTKKKAKKKAKRKAAKKTATRKVSEPGTLALMGAGLVAAGAARKLGRRKKKAS